MTDSPITPHNGGVPHATASMSRLFSDMATAINLTRPDGIVAQRFVKNATSETFSWWHHDLRTDHQIAIAFDLSAADAQYLQGMLAHRGWR